MLIMYIRYVYDILHHEVISYRIYKKYNNKTLNMLYVSYIFI